MSIIIPIHNCGLYLERCLDSVVNQTYRNLEIILIVDNSSDNSYEICKKYKKKDQRIILKKVKLNNVGKVRNEGLKICTGNYIGFVDGDDYIEKKMYEAHCLNILNTQADISACGFYFEEENGNVYKQNYSPNCIMHRDEFPEKIYYNKGMQGYIWNKLYSRELIFNGDDFIHFNTNIYVMEDDLFNFQIFDNNKKFKVSYICNQLYHYIKHNNTATKSYNEKYLTMFLAMKDEIYYLEKNRIDSNLYMAKYSVLFARDQYLMKKNKLINTKTYEQIYSYYKEIDKKINIRILPISLKIKIAIARFMPFIYKIWLKIKKRY